VTLPAVATVLSIIADLPDEGVVVFDILKLPVGDVQDDDEVSKNPTTR
jgi:hypothetical protein